MPKSREQKINSWQYSCTELKKIYAEVFAILSFKGLQNALKKTANILSIYFVRCVVLTARLLLTHPVFKLLTLYGTCFAGE